MGKGVNFLHQKKHRKILNAMGSKKEQNRWCHSTTKAKDQLIMATLMSSRRRLILTRVQKFGPFRAHENSKLEKDIKG
ncbi:Hypothetical predicted protein, partial [Olea europaea subsp. europaea]